MLKALITILVLIVIGIYLYVQAPEPLPELEVASGEMIPIETALTLVAAENDVSKDSLDRGNSRKRVSKWLVFW